MVSLNLAYRGFNSQPVSVGISCMVTMFSCKSYDVVMHRYGARQMFAGEPESILSKIVRKLAKENETGKTRKKLMENEY